MKEIILINRGDNIEKLSYRYGFDKNLRISDGRILKKQYITLKDGQDDIVVVNNYHPYYITNSVNNSSLSSNGYEVIDGVSNVFTLFYKPSGIKYYVKPLEKIEEISKKFGVDIEDIIKGNNLQTKKLFVGQLLII